MLIERCICGSTNFPRLFGKHGLIFAECECGVQHLHSDATPAEYEAQYEGAYHAATDRHPGCIPYRDRFMHDLSIAKHRWRAYRAIAREVGASLTSSLDVGAATGAFVAHLATQGIEAFGVDPDPAMASAQVFTGTSRLFSRRFDLVTYHDVLEHVINPGAELLQARRLITDNGLLVVDVPDVSTESGHHHYKAEHPWYFTQAALAELLTAFDFNPIHFDKPIPGKLVVYARPA